MFACFLLLLIGFAVCVCLLRGSDSTAHMLLKTASHVFEHETEPGAGLAPPATILSGGASKPTKRKHFTPLVSKQIAARQQFRCAICNRLFDDQLWDLDHIVPLFRGGSNELSNIRALCRACHMDLSARQQAV